MKWKGGHLASVIRYLSRLERREDWWEEREWLSLEEVSSRLVVSDADVEVLREMAPAMIGQIMGDELNLREREILKNFAYGGTGSEMAARLELSDQRVSQLLAQALSRLRHPRIRRILRPLLDAYD